jgi:FixJ family two-component response regulator
MADPIVYVVDDDEMVLRGVSRLLQSAGLRVLAYHSSPQFLEEHDPDRPGCAVLDLVMPGVDGLAIQDRLAAAGTCRPIIFLSGLAELPQGVAAMKRGAVDFLTKPVVDVDLINAVGRGIEIDRLSRSERANVCEIKSLMGTLTPRESEVLAHVVGGMLNKQIAAALSTTEGTIKVHRGRVMKKLGAVSLADLVRIADVAGVTRVEQAACCTKVQ